VKNFKFITESEKNPTDFLKRLTLTQIYKTLFTPNSIIHHTEFMVKTLTILTLLLLTLLTSSHECIHDKIQHDIKVSDPEFAMYDVMDGRALQTYQNIRILVDQSSKLESNELLFIPF